MTELRRMSHSQPQCSVPTILASTDFYRMTIYNLGYYTFMYSNHSQALYRMFHDMKANASEVGGMAFVQRSA
jgi:hypothetical protein